MGGLRSLTIQMHPPRDGRPLDSFVGLDIQKLIDLTDVTVNIELRLLMACVEDAITTDTEDMIILKDSWRRTKGEREWKRRGVYCRLGKWGVPCA